MSDDWERFTTAQVQRLGALQLRVADRPADEQYLTALLQTATGDYTELELVPVPTGVSRTAANALIEDVSWCQGEPPPPGTSVSAYPNAYDNHRVDTARRASQRKQTQARRASPLAGLLSLDPPP